MAPLSIDFSPEYDGFNQEESNKKWSLKDATTVTYHGYSFEVPFMDKIGEINQERWRFPVGKSE